MHSTQPNPRPGTTLPPPPSPPLPPPQSRAEVAQLSDLIAAHPDLFIMDGTMWLHNPRRLAIEREIRSPDFGAVRQVVATFMFKLVGDDIRIHKGLDGLGCLGDIGWYCTNASLWAKGWERPRYVVANPAAVINDEGGAGDGMVVFWGRRIGPTGWDNGQGTAVRHRGCSPGLLPR